MIWWKRNRKRVRNNPFRDALAQKIASRIIRCQHWLVQKLQMLENHCTLAQKKVLLVIFCLAFGGYCTFLLGRTISRMVTPAAQSPPGPAIPDSIHFSSPFKQ